ncbi:MAG: YdcF family protein [Cellvibrionaceae bacterium]
MILRAVLKAFVLPPMLNILMVLLGLLMWRYHKKLGKFLIILSVLLLWIFSTPLLSQLMVSTLETQHPPINIDKIKAEYAVEEKKNNSAIVILGGGRYHSAPEYHGADTVSVKSLNRLRYGAMLSKLLGLPILTTGGHVFAGSREHVPPESLLMKEVLEKDFNVRADWIEDRSRTTAENAKYSVILLQENTINEIFLVTHASHMPRAVSVFEKEITESGKNIRVIPAPMGYFSTSDTPNFVMNLMPKSSALQTSRVALHEWLGRLYYALSN